MNSYYSMFVCYSAFLCCCFLVLSSGALFVLSVHTVFADCHVDRNLYIW